MTKFTELLQDYYLLYMLKGEKTAEAWLDKVIVSPDGIAAVKEMIFEAVNQAHNMSESGASIEEYETAYKERQDKKGEDLN